MLKSRAGVGAGAAKNLAGSQALENIAFSKLNVTDFFMHFLSILEHFQTIQNFFFFLNPLALLGVPRP